MNRVFVAYSGNYTFDGTKLVTRADSALPHRRLANDKGGQIDGARVTLIVEPGMRKGDHGEPMPVGVPFGSRAWLILLRLQSEALRTQSHDVELGRNLHEWLKKMGIPIGGELSGSSRPN